MFRDTFKSVFVLICFVVAACQGQASTDDNEESGGSNKVVILGVVLSLTVICAISGVFIGLYFRVEKICCCCCCGGRRNDEEVKEEEDMTSSPAGGGGYDNPVMYNVQEQIRPHPPTSGTRRKMFFSSLPKSGGGRTEKSSLVMETMPAAFGATSTQIDQNGRIVKSTTSGAANDSSNVISFADSSSFNYQAYGDAASGGQEDILY